MEYDEAQKSFSGLQNDNLVNCVSKDTNGKMNGTSQNLTDTTEMMLTFKIGSHALISNNSLKPNSAVRQLFPCTKTTNINETDQRLPYLITSERLRAFEEDKRTNLCRIVQNDDSNESIKQVIERNTLRRSLIRCEPKHKKNVEKTDNSLVERIKQLTCDADEPQQDLNIISTRLSPTGAEATDGFEVNSRFNKLQDKNFSPSSSSTGSSNSSMSSTYKKISDIFGKREKTLEIHTSINKPKCIENLPDIGAPRGQDTPELCNYKASSLTENKKQLLSNLGPLTACVSNIISNSDECRYHLPNEEDKSRTADSRSMYTEYVLETINEGMIIKNEGSEHIAPDVLDGTEQDNNCVEQDLPIIKRITKKYQSEEVHNDEDDELDDYGFNKRPCVQGIKSAYGTTTEILQHIQNQLQLPISNSVAWPYYSESGLTGKPSYSNCNMNQNYIQYSEVPEKINGKHVSPRYPTMAFKENNSYQHCANQRLIGDFCKADLNSCNSVITIDDANEYYQSFPKTRYSRSLSPPPLEMSKKFYQTMVYIPYNHIEGYQQSVSPNSYYRSHDVNHAFNKKQINKGHVEPIYQQEIYHVEKQICNPAISYNISNATFLNSHQSVFATDNQSESPFVGQFLTAKATQTTAPLSTCNFFRANFKYRAINPIWKNGTHTTKEDQHSFLFRPRYPTYTKIDNISSGKGDNHHSGKISNGYSTDVNNYVAQEPTTSGHTKLRYNERGIPEGAVSTNSFDCTNISQNSVSLTSPTTPENCIIRSNSKPLFYSMNV